MKPTNTTRTVKEKGNAATTGRMFPQTETGSARLACFNADNFKYAMVEEGRLRTWAHFQGTSASLLSAEILTLGSKML